ncbi:MAG TPA: CocE/NonD family hydrolase [Flavipsychrobacter sp.]|nr:CocE/NonD family hydrolase [Flavipsychrobacter sp.]
MKKINKNLVEIFFEAIVLLLIGNATTYAQKQKLPDSSYIIQDSILIPTRSGVSISAIIVRQKTNEKPLPAILFYTTYYEGSGDAILGKRSADRDYVGVVAYARGIRTDLKDYAPYEHEATDIYDIIDWISNQQWCNGKIGMLGGSYTGFAQWATVKNLHPALKTIVPQVAVMPGFDMPYENNVPIGNILSWSNDNIYKNPPLRRSLPFEWFENGTSFRSLDSLSGQKNSIYQKWLGHPAYDSYWQSLVPTPAEYAQINIPVLSTTGYYDGSQIAALQYFKQHTRYNKNANHYFVIGPYDHMGGQRNANPDLMGYAIDPVADISMRDLAYQWLDFILKEKPKPELLKDKVNYQVMGTNSWKHSPSLKKLNNDTLTFYLSNKKIENQYKLEKYKPKDNSFIIQSVDFKDRENQNNYFTPTIIFDTLDASNGLVYVTEKFDSDFEMNGSFIGNLFTSINKKDLDVSLALYEILPSGKYFFLTRYVGRASYAKNNSKRQLLSPGKKESIPFNNTRFVSKKISKGSRLAILLNTNKHPFEEVNYGSGKEVHDETLKDANVPLQIKWYNDSYIKIPVWKY